MTTLHDVGGGLGRPLGTCLLGSHNFVVTAHGSCVKWPLLTIFPPELGVLLRKRLILFWCFA